MSPRLRNTIDYHCWVCEDLGTVCENHPDRPWGEMTDSIESCDCGAGMPCPKCCDPMPEDGTASAALAFVPTRLR